MRADCNPRTTHNVRRVEGVRARNDRSLGLDERARSHCDGPWPHLQPRRARVQWVMCRRVSSRCRRRTSLCRRYTIESREAAHG